MKLVDVSIIIPAYNSAKTIRKCLDSCITQENVEIECIVVDDCSTDETPEILLEYCKRYPDTIRVLTQPENKRQGAARNAAFKAAMGEFIFFVDSDDWIETDTCCTLLNLCRFKAADIAVGSYEIVYPESNDTVYTFQSATEYLGTMTKEKREQLLLEKGYFWCKMYRRAFLKRLFPDGQLFPEKIFYEDSYYNTLATLGAEIIVRTDHICYHYRQNTESTVRKIENQLDKIEIAKMLIEKAEDPEWTEYKDIILYKASTLCAAALLYGWIPLYKRKTTNALNSSLETIVKLVPILRGGGVLDVAQ